MGASQTRTEHQYQSLADKTGFSLEQIKNLHQRFQHLSGNEEKISRENLDSIPALANNPIKKQIIEAFFDKRNQHQEEVGFFEEIGFEQFLMVMSHFRPPTLKMTEEEKQAMRKEKLRFLFNMHDTDNDGTITLDEYRKVVEELLSKSGAIDQEAAKAIADAAMLEVASTNVPHMGPDDFYEGITFEHFEQILKGLEMESRMHIRFLGVDTTTMRCGKSTS
ncbi:calcineurin B homologous protein 3-like [Parambassis ranga]|uniref:Calcineurin B homologous protein 3 n=1 Tax=Parambassis ranga TaxID=210632 RepID=A0A6P7J0I5_9TELE|nr:calcineurin B homologous protein 3-like [Parambassis ranga]XP_028270071.1 calcineurin B homologous protein 3-like [Parambassis ranga]